MRGTASTDAAARHAVVQGIHAPEGCDPLHLDDEHVLRGCARGASQPAMRSLGSSGNFLAFGGPLLAIPQLALLHLRGSPILQMLDNIFLT